MRDQDEKRLTEIERKHKEAETRMGKLVPGYESSLSADVKWMIEELREAWRIIEDHRQEGMDRDLCS